MLSEFRHSVKPNFIKRNILSCSSSSKVPSGPTSGLSVSGAAINLLAKKQPQPSEPSKEGAKIDPVSVSIIQLEVETSEKKPLKIKKSPKILHAGVRRTSIKHIRIPIQPEVQPEVHVIEKSRKSHKKKVTFNTRQCLRLSVTDIAPPNNPEILSSLYTKQIGQILSKKVKEVCEAIDKRSARSTKPKGRFERFLLAMDSERGYDEKTRSFSSISCSDSTDKRTRKDSTSRDKKSGVISPDYLNNIYQKVYQRHFDALTSIIAQEERESGESHTEVVKERKKKETPRLEISICANSRIKEKSVRHVTKDFEQMNVFEEVDCGNLTPVITYNHVSTVNTSDEFQFTAATTNNSQKGSRSPSPLLDVPNLPCSDIVAKRPPV